MTDRCPRSISISISALALCSLAFACVDDLPSVPSSGGGSTGPQTTGITTFPAETTIDDTLTAGPGDTTVGDELGTTTVVDSADTDTTSVAETGSSSGDTASSGDSGTTAGFEDDTIYEIQNGTIATGASVDVRGVVVTGVGPSGFFAQEPAGGQYSGVYVFVGALPTVLVGDEVDLVGVTEEFSELTEINASMGAVNPTGVTAVALAPELVALADLTAAAGEPWESVLVRIEGAPLAVVSLPGFSEFDVGDGGPATTRIDDFLHSVFDYPLVYPDFGIGASFTAISGPLNFTFGEFKVSPRNDADLEGYVGGPPLVGVSVEDLVPGDLVITEIMFDPNCAADSCEWIEIYNASGLDVNLFGLRIQDSALSVATQGTIATDVVVLAGTYAIVAKGSAVTWPYMTAPAAYYGPNPGLNNTGDLAVLLNSVEILDQTGTYPTFGASDNGISWKLDPAMIDAVSNDDPMNWCYSTVVFDSPAGIDEYGSPGGPNEAACAML